MNKNLLKTNVLTLSLLIGGGVFAQQSPTPTCAADLVQEQLFANNPKLKEVYEAKRANFLALKKEGRLQAKANQKFEIPVVVHILNDGTGKYNPTEQQISNWIARANSIFDGSASDIKSTDEGGTTLPIKLVLAKRTPQNKATNGILNHDLSGNSSYVNYGVDGNGLSNQYLQDNYGWDSNSYYNVFVTNMIDGVNPSTPGISSYTAGYAYYPGGSMDLSVMLYHVAVNTRDTTFAHEMMHALGVAHPFNGGDGNGQNCGSEVNDGIDDTQRVRSGLFFGNPNQTFNQYTTYPTVGTTINDCIDTDPAIPFDHTINNIMNYGRILDRFTPGQGDMALAAIQYYRYAYQTSKALQEPAAETIEGPKTACVPENITGVSGLAANRGYGMGMTLVKLGTINNQTSTHYGPTPKFYNDYSNLSNINTIYTANLEIGKQYTFTTGTASGNPNKYVAYIDYNNNGVFDANEIVINGLTITASINNAVKTNSATFVVPQGAVLNTPLRMRVIGDWAYATDFSACGDRLYGEVEDYAVIISEATSTVWDGTKWSNGDPTPTKEAIVRGDLVLNSGINTNKFTLDSGSVTIDSGFILSPEVINNLTADKFVIKSHGLYQQGSTDKAVGEFTVIQNSSPMILNDATLWSSPVKGQNLRNFSPNTLLKRFYQYNETENKFSSIFVDDPLYPNNDLKDPNTYTFEPGVGYHIRAAANQSATVPSEFEGKFVGELNSGRIEIPATLNKFGYNLVGNPYPSNIVAMQFLNGNPNVEALYFWTQQSPLTSDGYAANNYAAYTRAGGVSAAAGNETPSGNISKGQGFFVEMNAPVNVVFQNYFRYTSSGNMVMHKNGDDTTSQDETKRIRLNLFEGTLSKNQILVAYMNEATNGFDNQIDGKANRMYEGSKLYTLIDGSVDKYIIQGRDPKSLENDIVKLGFEAKSAGVYTIKLANIENIANQSVYLRDKQDNQVIDLTKTSYQFNSEAGTFDERFELVYKLTTLSTTDLDKLSNDVNVVKTSTGLKVISTKELSSIEVYDISGRQVYSKSIKGLEALITGLSKSNQVLVVKAITKEGKIVNTKVIY